MSRPVRVAVFASGGGSNFQALLDRERRGDASWETVLLLADRASAGALDRAEAAGVPTAIVSFRQRDLDEIDAEMRGLLDEAGVEAIFLAGFLRLIPPGVVQGWRGRMVNIHPALLPAFGGKGMWGRHVHEAVLRSGARVTGPTVHFVSEAYDEGAILAQWPVPVLDGDSPETLAARVLEAEHALYPLAAEHLCRALLEGRAPLPLDPPAPHFISAAAPPSSHTRESIAT